MKTDPLEAVMRIVPLLVVSLCLAASAWAATGPFAEFRVPEHRTWSGIASLDLSGSRYHEGTARDDRGQGTAGVSLARGWDSDRLRYTAGIALRGDLGRSRTTYGYDYPFERVERVSRAQNLMEAWTLDGSVRAYPWDAPVGIDLAANGSGSYGQDWSEQAEHGVQLGLPSVGSYHRTTYTARHRYAYQASLRATAGIGRVRDATVVYSVHVLEQRLLATGAVTRALSAAARERLAAILYLKGAFDRAHDYPERHAWREIERVLREDGALAGAALDAYDVLRAQERIEPRGTLTRLRGWFAGPTIRAASSHSIDREDRRLTFRRFDADTLTYSIDRWSGQRSVWSYDDAWAGLRAEYHRPLGWAWQVDLEAVADRPLRPGQRGLDLATSAVATWMIADRWEASGSVSQSREYYSPRNSEGWLAYDEWTTACGAALAYYLEDRTRLSLSVRETQRSSRGNRFIRDTQFRLGLTFRFLGALDAPGLLEPVRPLY